MLVEGGWDTGSWPHSHTPIAEAIFFLGLHLNFIPHRRHDDMLVKCRILCHPPHWLLTFQGGILMLFSHTS